MTHERHREPYDNVLETIGWTPLIRLHRVLDGARTPVYAKAEIFNPGGSVKDRIGIEIIEAAEREGRLKPGGTVVEGTSGNTGVGLAIAAALKGYRCVFTIPDKMSAEKVRLLKGFGAQVIVTPTAVAPDHPDYYGNVARRIAEETPNAILADQFFNPINPEAHYRSTGPEIWEQTEGAVTHFVTAAGTGGTITGVARYLKERNPAIRVVAGDPEGSIFAEYFRTGVKGTGTPYKVEGIGNDKIPGTLEFELIDEVRTVSDVQAFHVARRITREEGLFVGGSSGLIVHVATQIAHEVDDPDACIVCVLCDTGERYLSKLYNDEWMAENRLFSDAPATAAEMLTSKGERAGTVISVSPQMPVRAALELIEAHDVSQLPVLEEGRSVGAVTEAALMSRVIAHPEVLDVPIAELSGEPFPTLPPDADVAQISDVLSKATPAVLVVEDGQVRGIITRHDVLRHLLRT